MLSKALGRFGRLNLGVTSESSSLMISVALALFGL
jgi:hypothetical protein